MSQRSGPLAEVTWDRRRRQWEWFASAGAGSPHHARGHQPWRWLAILCARVALRWQLILQHTDDTAKPWGLQRPRE